MQLSPVYNVMRTPAAPAPAKKARAHGDTEMSESGSDSAAITHWGSQVGGGGPVDLCGALCKCPRHVKGKGSSLAAATFEAFVGVPLRGVQLRLRHTLYMRKRLEEGPLPDMYIACGPRGSQGSSHFECKDDDQSLAAYPALHFSVQKGSSYLECEDEGQSPAAYPGGKQHCVLQLNSLYYPAVYTFMPSFLFYSSCSGKQPRKQVRVLQLSSVYDPTVYPDHASGNALASANKIMSRLTIPGRELKYRCDEIKRGNQNYVQPHHHMIPGRMLQSSDVIMY
eukprot:1160247-Pelagomonas_calceolata.AAC.7